MFFFLPLFGCPKTNFGPLSRRQPQSLNVNHTIFTYLTWRLPGDQPSRVPSGVWTRYLPILITSPYLTRPLSCPTLFLDIQDIYRLHLKLSDTFECWPFKPYVWETFVNKIIKWWYMFFTDHDVVCFQIKTNEKYLSLLINTLKGWLQNGGG